MNADPIYEQIYMLVRQIPAGKVATYGQIAGMVTNCTARMVGYAMSALPPGSDVPWQRVINARGKISLRSDSRGNALQRQLLEEEGIPFDTQDQVNLRRYRWSGPQMDWLIEYGFNPEANWRAE
jgi:methylated-DNA-protein-cysteine methyltransferase-like protein